MKRLVVAALLVWSSVAAAGRLHVEGGHFRDERGAVIVLRGYNATGDAKVPPFRPIVGDDFFAPLRDWGANVVRLLFIWEAYEAELGVYDESYLDYFEAAVDAAEQAGLHVIVDFHQDAFSRFSVGGCGDGFPAWAIPDGVVPLPPDNGPACADWGERMSTDEDMAKAWEAFHADASGVRSRYLAMVASVAARLAERDVVIGYDFMNEPWGDEVTQIALLYRDAATAIREVDPDAILFCSPHALVSAGTESQLPAPTFANRVYAPHFYDPGIFLLGSWLGQPPTMAFAKMRAKAEEFQAPLFLGEFGAPAGTIDGPLYLAAVYDLLDETFASAAQWTFTPGWTETGKDGWNSEDFSVVDGAGAPREMRIVRPYPRRIAGEPVSFRYTPADEDAIASFELRWNADPALGDTEVVFDAGDAFLAGTAALLAENATCSYAAELVSCQAMAIGAARVRLVGDTAEPPIVRQEENDGCGCRAGGQGSPTWAAAALLLAVAVLLRRR